MFTRYFKTGNITLRVETEEPLDVGEPFSRFLSDEADGAVRLKFTFADKIEPSGSFVSGNRTADIFSDGESYNFCYRSAEDGYYAMRTVNLTDTGCQSVLVSERYRGMLWTRAVFSLMGFEDIAASLGASVFHSSFAEYEGEAILFTAPCGTGKSTQARLWEKCRNSFTVNGDKALIYEQDGVLYAAGLPFSGSSDICHNRILPVKAIVRLGQAKENTVRRLSGINAFKFLYEGCYRSLWNNKFSENTAELITFIASAVPVFKLDCLPDESAVETLENAFESIN